MYLDDNETKKWLDIFVFNEMFIWKWMNENGFSKYIDLNAKECIYGLLINYFYNAQVVALDYLNDVLNDIKKTDVKLNAIRNFLIHTRQQNWWKKAFKTEQDFLSFFKQNNGLKLSDLNNAYIVCCKHFGVAYFDLSKCTTQVWIDSNSNKSSVPDVIIKQIEQIKLIINAYKK